MLTAAVLATARTAPNRSRARTDAGSMVRDAMVTPTGVRAAHGDGWHMERAAMRPTAVESARSQAGQGEYRQNGAPAGLVPARAHHNERTGRVARRVAQHGVRHGGGKDGSVCPGVGKPATQTVQGAPRHTR